MIFNVLSDFAESGMIATITVLLILGIPIWILLIYFGIKMCINNNTMGIVILFIPLNVIGILIGCCLISNARQGRYNNKEIPQELLELQEKHKEKEQELLNKTK